MKIVKPNWYNLNHEAVRLHFEGDVSFVNDFCVNGEYTPSAVYRAARPNKTKGHKRYMLLTKTGKGFVVRGMSRQEINKFRYQQAIHCLHCDEVIYSINQHDYRKCSCGKVMIDGGREYTRYGGDPQALFKLVLLDLLTDTVSDIKE